MSAEPSWRERLAAAIADGEAVNYPQAVALSESQEVTDFRELERIAKAFARAAAAAPPAAAPRLPTLFRWGSLEVLEKVGEGAFGEVFRAYDPVLERDVALKLRRGGPSAVEQSGRRYLEEARRLARVRHPHVLAVYGAAVHDGRVGLWTELIDGESLEERLVREGPLPAEETLRIGLDLASALTAIHRAGLAHGDVKAANVLQERGGRVVLADLSAARELDGSPVGALEGTPLAMAPELLEGGTPGPSSDLYALGALLFRLLSGRHPVEATTLAELRERLAALPVPSLAFLRPDLPEALTGAVDRAIARDARERFASAVEMAEALAVEPEATPSPGTDRAGRWRRRGLVAGAVGIAGAAGLWFAVQAGPRFAEGLPMNPGLAVLGFQTSGSGDTTGLRSALSELLVTDLGAGSGLHLAPPEAIARMRRDLRLDGSDRLPPATLAAIGRNLDVVVVASGAVHAAAGEPRQLEIVVRLERVDRPGTVLTARRSGSETELLALVADLAQELRRALGAPPAVAATSRLWPLAPEASRLYAVGLEKLRDGDARGALVPLTRATELAPESAGPWFAWAQAEQALGGRARAVEPARTAFRLAAGLPELERRRIEVFYYRMTNEWEAALAAVRAAVAASPGDPDLELARVDLEVAAGHPREALALLDKLQAPGTPGAHDARFAIARCRVLQRIGDWPRMVEAARVAREMAKAQASPYYEARASLHQSAALCYLGRPHEGAPLAAEAVRLAALVADPKLSIDALNAQATVAKYSHERSAAEAVWRQALAAARAIGDRLNEQTMLYNLAVLAGDQGNLHGQAEHGRQALAICNELRLEGCSVELSTMLGGVLLYTGPIDEAHELLTSALDYHRQHGQRSREGEAIAFLAEWAQKRDDLAASGGFARQWLALMRENGEPRLIDWARANVFWVELDGGADIDPDGELAAVARRAAEQKDTDLEGMARGMRGLAALRRGRLDLAESETRHAIELVPPPVTPFICYFNWWIRGDVLLARGELAELDREVPRLLELTRRLGVVSEELEGELLAARLTAAHGDAARARANLVDLAAEARAKGYLRTARRATDAAARLGRS